MIDGPMLRLLLASILSMLPIRAFAQAAKYHWRVFRHQSLGASRLTKNVRVDVDVQNLER